MQHDELLVTARVIAQHRGKYRVSHDGREYWAKVTGKAMYAAGSPLDFPVVGDQVEIVETGYGNAVIKGILPRKSVIERKAPGRDAPQPIAANVDAAFIVEAVDRDFNLNRFERYMAIVRAANIDPVLVLNKTDLISAKELKEMVSRVKDRFKDTPLLTASAAAEGGMNDLALTIEKGRIYCFLGSSGVGKSSLINRMLGRDILRTKELSGSTKKGKHTTTHRELFELGNGGMVIDNPGMREVGLADAAEGVKSVFSDIEKLGRECRFSDCSHQHEPGCAVLEAVKSGGLLESKYDNYLKLRKESEYYSMTNLEKRKKDRSFGKMVKAFKDHKNKQR